MNALLKMKTWMMSSFRGSVRIQEITVVNTTGTLLLNTIPGKDSFVDTFGRGIVRRVELSTFFTTKVSSGLSHKKSFLPCSRHTSLNLHCGLN